jgi:polyisoprenoid-binding protein YceI
VLTFTLLSHAQTGGYKVDSDHSDARFSIDDNANHTNQTITLGAARVAGTVNLDKNDLADSTFAFNLYPATSLSPAIDQEGRPVKGSGSDLANYALVSFQSERISSRGNGQFQVTGNLVLTRIDRNADYAPTEAYAGPVYSGPAIIHRVVRDASFVVALSDPPSAENGRNPEIEVSATGAIVREDFPELLEALSDMSWPPVVQDQKCAWPAKTGEDYAGASCTGNVVELPYSPVIHTGIGEDYSGPRAASVQHGNHLTILLHMRLTGEQPQLSAKVGQ